MWNAVRVAGEALRAGSVQELASAEPFGRLNRLFGG